MTASTSEPLSREQRIRRLVDGLDRLASEIETLRSDLQVLVDAYNALLPPF